MSLLWRLHKNVTERKQRMPGELLEDDPVVAPYTAFEVKVRNVILDTVVGSINRRPMQTLRQMLLALTLKFPRDEGKWTPQYGTQQEISKCVLRFDDRATLSRLYGELYNLASMGEIGKKSITLSGQEER